MPDDIAELRSRVKARPAPAIGLDEPGLARPKRRRVRKGLWIGAVLVLALALGLAAYRMTAGVEAPEIATAEVTRGDVVRSVLATGVLEPVRLVSVGAQVSGQVERLHVELGDTVSEGELIAEIDSTTQQNNVRNEEAGLANVRAQMAARQANLHQAELNFRRQEELLAADAVSRADYESAEAEVGTLRAEVTALEAQIQQAELELSTARVNLAYTRILAPMDGTVVAIVTEEGRTVNANQSAPTIVKLAQLDTMTVKAEISEADVDKVAPGQTVFFTTLGNQSKRHPAALRAIAPAPASIANDDSSGGSSDSAVYYDGLFDVENSDGLLRTGMTVQVTIVLDAARDVLTVPMSALGPQGDDGDWPVQVAGPGGVLEDRRVTIGVTTNTMAEALAGLDEGEQVVVRRAGGQAAEATGRGQGWRAFRP